MRYHVTRAAGEGALRALHAESCPLRPKAREEERALGEHDGCASALGAAREAGEAVAPCPRCCAACL